MEALASQIKRELQAQTHMDDAHWAIYEDELQVIWPLDDGDRESGIAQFATDYGFHLKFYKAGLCAIFVKEGAGGSGKLPN